MYKTCITPIRRNAPGRCGEGGCRAPTLWPKTERAKARKSLFGRGLRPLRFADPRRHPRGVAVSGNGRPSPSPCALRTKGIRGEVAAQPVSPYSPKTRPDQRILLETPGETLGEPSGRPSGSPSRSSSRGGRFLHGAAVPDRTLRPSQGRVLPLRRCLFAGLRRSCRRRAADPGTARRGFPPRSDNRLSTRPRAG